MSWRARMVEDYAYFPKPYPLGPGPSKTKSTMTAKTKTKSKPSRVVHPVTPKSTVSTLSANTTMSGFPLRVRSRIEAKPDPEPESLEELPTSRLAHYTFTFGLSKEDEEQFRSDLPSPLTMSRIGVQTQPSFTLGKKPSGTSGIISERLKEIKQSFHKAGQLPRPYHPKPYFQNWGQPEAGQELNLDESEIMLNTTQKIFNHSGPNEGWDSYFDGLDEMDRRDEDHDVGRLSKAELKVARAAFRPPTTNPSRLQSKTLRSEVEKPGASGLVSMVSLNRNRTRAVSAAPSTLSKTSSKKVQQVEPNAAVFIQQPPLNPSHGDKIVLKQLQREAAASPMTREQYGIRKNQLMAAALRASSQFYCNTPGIETGHTSRTVYDPELPTYELMPDIRDEALHAEEKKKDVSRRNVMDLLYHALTNQSTSISMKSPATSLHLSSAHFSGRETLEPLPRPLDQFSGPVVSTILRELKEARGIGGSASYARETVPVNTGRISRRTPPIRKPNKEKMKALRALENYDLSKIRQRKYMEPKPVLTLLSVKNTGNVLSNFSRVGGPVLPGTMRSAPSPQRRTDQEVNTDSSQQGPGSFTALSSPQTRNEKYNTGKVAGRVNPARKSPWNKPKLSGTMKRRHH